MACRTDGYTLPSNVSISFVSINGTYGIGKNVTIRVSVAGGFDNLTDVEHSRILLDTGDTKRFANYEANSSSYVDYIYTVQEGDQSDDLDYNATDSLYWGLASRNINLGNGTAYNCLLPEPGSEGSLANQSDIVIDSTAPYVENVTAAVADGTYGLGAEILVRANFSEPVAYLGANPPSLILNFSGENKTATAQSGNNTAALIFNYTVLSGDATSGLDYAGTDALMKGGNVTDAGGNIANLTLAQPGTNGSLGASSSIATDVVVPYAMSVSSPNQTNATYAMGDDIHVRVNFSEAMTVRASDGGAGTPFISLDVGTTAHDAPYSGGNGTDVLSFVYTVRSGAVTESLNHTGAISLNGSSVTDAAWNAANLTLPDPSGPDSLAQRSPGIRVVTPPAVTLVSSPNAAGLYGIGDTVNINVGFTAAVSVDAGMGSPVLTLETGTTDRNATYASGSGTPNLLFAYTVMEGDESSDLDYASMSALMLNGGSLNGTGIASSLSAIVALPGPSAPNSLAATSDIAVDGIAPAVEAASSPGGSRTYAVGEVVSVQLNFTENVTVGSGAPSLALSISGAERQAAYASGNGTDMLSFNYTVRAGDVAADLDYAGTDALERGSGDIVDAAGNPANTTLAAPGSANSLGAMHDIELNGAIPAVNRVTSPNASGTYEEGDRIDIVVEMTQGVTVAGASMPPLYLAIVAGPNASVAAAPYSLGSGTANLTFSYTVAAGNDAERLGYANSTALVLNGTDAAVAGLNGVAANLTLPVPGANKSLSGSEAPEIAINTTVAPPPQPTPPPTPPQPALAAVVLVNATLTGPNTIAVYYNASIGASASSYENLTLTPGGPRNVELAAGNGTAVHTLRFDGERARSDASGTMGIDAFSNGSVRFAGDPSVDVLDGQPYPFVHSVMSTNARGSSYTAGASIPITVQFSEDVLVREIDTVGRGGGSQMAVFCPGCPDTTLYMVLNTGSNATLETDIRDVTRLYNFTYVVEEGDDSGGPLNYMNESSLLTDADNIVVNNTRDDDSAGEQAVDLTLPRLDSADSLAGTSNLFVYSPPGIANLSAPAGTYSVGSRINITIDLTRSLTVSGGVPSLELGSSAKSAVYRSGNGTATYVFEYIVQAGDTARSLFAQPALVIPAGATTYLSTPTGVIFAFGDSRTAADPTPAAAAPTGGPALIGVGDVTLPGDVRTPPTPPPSRPAAPTSPVVASPFGGFGGGGGGGGGGGRGGGSGGVGLAIGSGGVTLYSVSWDCRDDVIKVVLNEDAYIPDVTVLSSTGSSSAAKSEVQDLEGRIVYETALPDDTILSIRVVSVDGRAVSTASELVRTGGACTGEATFVQYGGAAAQQQPAKSGDSADEAPADRPAEDAQPQPPRADAPQPPADDMQEQDAQDREQEQQQEQEQPPAAIDRPDFEIEDGRDASYYVKRYAEQSDYRQWFEDAYPQYADICEAVGVEPGCVEAYQRQQEQEDRARDDDAEDEQAVECAEGMVMRDGECVVEDAAPPAQPPSDDDSGCLIATAAFGTELAPQVQLLREVRDGTVLSTGAGSAFMSSFSQAYYAFSPHVADLEREFPAFRHAAALLLAPMLYALQVVELAEPGSELGVLAFGTAAIALVAGMYVATPAAGAWYLGRRLAAGRISRTFPATG